MKQFNEENKRGINALRPHWMWKNLPQPLGCRPSQQSGYCRPLRHRRQDARGQVPQVQA